MDNMREEYAKMFNEFADKYDQFSNQWQDMTIEEVFIQGCIASRAALVVQFTAETYFSPCKTDLELAHDDGFNSAMNSVKAALDSAGVKYE